MLANYLNKARSVRNVFSFQHSSYLTTLVASNYGKCNVIFILWYFDSVDYFSVYIVLQPTNFILLFVFRNHHPHRPSMNQRKFTYNHRCIKTLKTHSKDLTRLVHFATGSSARELRRTIRTRRPKPEVTKGRGVFSNTSTMTSSPLC